MPGSILLVEDENGGVFQKLLEGAGHFVMLYENGQEALDDINGGLRYKLALVDQSLPGRGGDEVIELSKSMLPQVPVISISGQCGRVRGADRHLTKPIPPKELVKIVNSYFP